MKFPSPLKRGRLVKRYKRFLADMMLDDGTAITASCPNTGSMLGLTTPNSVVWVSQSDSPTRKYRHTWEMIEVAGAKEKPKLVGINTGHPNKIVAEAIAAGQIERLTGYADVRREVKYGINSRIDLLLQDPAKGLCYVEVKNVHLFRQPGLAEFPDSKTERGAKHLNEMSDMVRQGHRAVMLYLIQCDAADRFTVARDIDPAYGKAYDAAAACGVEMLAYRCRLTPETISLESQVAVR